jgi:hypothetical protein
VQDVWGVQAQASDAAAPAIRALCPRLVTANVERALAEERSIMRTWCLRGMPHLVAAADVPGSSGLWGSCFPRPCAVDALNWD